MSKENTRYVLRHGRRIEVETLNLDHLAPSPPRRKRDKPEGFSLDRFKSKRTPALAAVPKRRERHKNFAIVPLDDNWGYQAATAAGNGAAIILYALYRQRTGTLEVPITAAVLKQCGLSRKMRTRTIEKLVKLGFATARYRGNKFCGCPLLTLLLP
jgi:hypothetical protein